MTDRTRNVLLSAVGLIVLGVCLMLVGFALTGFDPATLIHQSHHWYSVLHLD